MQLGSELTIDTPDLIRLKGERGSNLSYLIFVAKTHGLGEKEWGRGREMESNLNFSTFTSTYPPHFRLR
jgi:hypothetical protein